MVSTLIAIDRGQRLFIVRAVATLYRAELLCNSWRRGSQLPPCALFGDDGHHGEVLGPLFCRLVGQLLPVKRTAKAVVVGLHA